MALREALKAPLGVTRSKPGCESLEVAVNQDQPDNILIIMRWQTRRQYEEYRQWRDAEGDAGRLAEATVSGLSTRFFDVGNT